MLRSFSRLVRFGALAAVAYGAAGPLLGMAGAMLGVRAMPIWIYGAAFSGSLLIVTWIALVLDGERLSSLGLTPTGNRVREFAIGFVLSAVLYAALHLVRAASVGAHWTPTGFGIVSTALPGLVVAMLLMLPEELLFRGYAFRRGGEILGPRVALGISAILFGLYHVAGSGMWAMGAFFTFAMPVLGGWLFGLAAQRTAGLALPIGLHLGGNWIQASVLAFRTEGPGPLPNAIWTAGISGTQFHALTAPDVPVHLPFMMMLAVMAIVTVIVFRPAPAADVALPRGHSSA